MVHDDNEPPIRFQYPRAFREYMGGVLDVLNGKHDERDIKALRFCKEELMGRSDMVGDGRGRVLFRKRDELFRDVSAYDRCAACGKCARKKSLPAGDVEDMLPGGRGYDA